MSSMSYRDTWGQRPEADESGGYCYTGYNESDTRRGYEAGFGITTGTLGDEHGGHYRADLLHGEGFFGAAGDGRIGAGGSVRAARHSGGYGQRGDGAYANGSLEAFGAGAESWINPESGASMGASAYIIQGDVSAGNIGSGARDEEYRLGLSYGVGAAGRLHWGDSDGDERAEYGFGADIGPVSFDLRTEDPLMTAAKMNPMTSMLAHGANMVLPDDFNLTESAGNAARGAYDAAASGVSYLGSLLSGW